MQNNLKISVIIPVYQDEKGLADTVNSMLAQDFPKQWYEIIIVDNNSKDGTKQAAMELQKAYPDLIKVVHQDQIQSSYAARNAGVKAAKGEICCFIDANMTADTKYLARVLRHFENDEELDYMGCRIQVVCNGKRTLSDWYNLRYDFQIEKYFKKDHFVVTACLSARKRVFERVGFFDKRLESSGDKEFGQRVYAAGLKQHYDDSLVLFHPSRSTYASIIKKYKRIARGHAQLTHYYPDRYSYHKSERYNMHLYIPFVLLKLPIGIVSSAGKFLYRLPIDLLAAVEFKKELRRLKNNKS